MQPVDPRIAAQRPTGYDFIVIFNRGRSVVSWTLYG